MVRFSVVKSDEELSFLKKEVKFLYDKWFVKSLKDIVVHNELAPIYSSAEDFYLDNVSMSDYWSWLRSNKEVNKLINFGFILPDTFSINVMAVEDERVVGFGYYHAMGVRFKSDNIDYINHNGNNFIGCFRGNDFIYVDHDFRGRGIGVRLMDLIINTAHDNNLLLIVSVLNDRFKESLSKYLGLSFSDNYAFIY